MIVPMLRHASSRLVVTDRARKKLRDRLSKITDYPAIARLLYGTEPRYPSEGMHWSISYCDRRVVDGPGFNGVLLTAAGIDFVLLQDNLVGYLDIAVLDFDGNRFVVRWTGPK